MKHISLQQSDKRLTALWLVFYGFLLTIFGGCGEGILPKPVAGSQKIPDYNQTSLQILSDTIHFPLTENTYNEIKSQNLFMYKGKELIAFFDRKSASVNIYQIPSGYLYKRIDIKKAFKNNKPYKGTIYFRSFDSIFVTHGKALYLIDSAGHVLNELDFPGEDLYAHFDNTRPPTMIGSHLYAGIRTTSKLSSLRGLRNWRLIVNFDLAKEKAVSVYQLSDIYLTNYFGYQFLDYGYCINNKGNFVFSFPADTNLYESNLAEFHSLYSARSQFQQSPISPVDKKALDSGQDLREYAIRDSYGSVFFDPYRKIYLRQAKQKISLADFIAKTGDRKQTIILLDEHFNIIGETEISKDVVFDSMLFTQNGNIYARVNHKDEYALHFVRLTYTNDKIKDKSASIAQSHTTPPNE